MFCDLKLEIWDHFPGNPKYSSICNTNFDAIFNTFIIAGETVNCSAKQCKCLHYKWYNAPLNYLSLTACKMFNSIAIYILRTTYLQLNVTPINIASFQVLFSTSYYNIRYDLKYLTCKIYTSIISPISSNSINPRPCLSLYLSLSLTHTFDTKWESLKQNTFSLVRRPTSWPILYESYILHKTEKNSYNQKPPVWGLLLSLSTPQTNTCPTGLANTKGVSYNIWTTNYLYLKMFVCSSYKTSYNEQIMKTTFRPMSVHPHTKFISSIFMLTPSVPRFPFRWEGATVK